MGFGADPLGAGPAGLDLPASTEQRVAAQPTALAFDGLTRDFVLDENGRYKRVHPVDAKVFLVLRTAIGSLSSAPTTGQAVSLITHIDPRTINAQVDNKVRSKLAAFVAAREIAIESVAIDTEIKGRIALEVTYTNLLTARREIARV